MKMRRELAIGLLAVVLFPVACRESVEAPAPGSTQGDAPLTKKGESPATDADFVGLTESEGAALAKERSLIHRIVSVDGQPRPATRDYRPERVNFDLVQGRIVKVSRG